MSKALMRKICSNTLLGNLEKMMNVSAAQSGSIMSETQLQEWRRRGVSEKRRVIAYFVLFFAVAVCALVLLAIRSPLSAKSAPLPGQRVISTLEARAARSRGN